MSQPVLQQQVITLGGLGHGPAQKPEFADQWPEMVGAAMSTTVFGWLVLNRAPLWTKVLAIGSAGLRVKSIRANYVEKKRAWYEQTFAANRYLAENPEVALASTPQRMEEA